MGRGMQNLPPYGQMGDQPRFDANTGGWDHPFHPQPPTPMPPITPPPASGFPGGGATDGIFPGGAAGGFPNFPHGSTGDTTGRVGNGWGKISGRESGPGNALSKSFSATGSSGANRPPGGSSGT